MKSLYFGVISEVYPPNHKFNTFKYQYEYVVQVTGEEFCQFQVTAIRNDSSGATDNYEDEILSVGDNVFIFFPRGDRSQGIIVGGPRRYTQSQDVAKGNYYLKRYNSIETYIDKDGNWSVTSDSGPHMHVRKVNIELNDSAGEEIILDKTTKTLTLKTKELVINATGNANITVNGNVNVKVGGTLNAEVSGAATVKAASLDAKIGGEAKVKAAKLDAKIDGEAKVKAGMINLNGSQGTVLTNVTDPVVDFITGVPTMGVPTVKSGGG